MMRMFSTYTQDGHLLEFVSSELKAVLAPLVDYVTTGDCWEDYDIQKHFDAYVLRKKHRRGKLAHQVLQQ